MKVSLHTTFNGIKVKSPTWDFLDEYADYFSIVNKLDSIKTFLGHGVADATYYVKSYLEAEAPNYHKSASKLGVQPTDSLIDASKHTYFRTTRTGYVIFTPNCPILNTCKGPVDIYPKNRKWLTIPLHREAARKSPRQLPYKLFKMGNALATNDIKTPTGKPTAMYALCKHVRLPANLTIYPDGIQISEKILEGFSITYETSLALFSMFIPRNSGRYDASLMVELLSKGIPADEAYRQMMAAASEPKYITKHFS